MAMAVRGTRARLAFMVILAFTLSSATFTVLRVQSAGAAGVANPGPVTMTVNGPGSFFNVAGNQFDLPSTATPTVCNNTTNDDVAVDDATQQQDTNIDFPADTQCGSAADDSEVKGGIQPRTYISLSGNVDAAGNISVPQAGINFPTMYVYSSQANGVIDIFPAATAAATGTLDPATGKATMHVDWQIQVQQSFLGIDCAAQISMDLSTDLADLANAGTIPVTPVPYDPSTGNVTITGNHFAVGAMMVTGGTISGKTGIIDASSTTFTDPNAAFTASDVGKTIVIVGAGAGGGNLNAKISAVSSATSITLNKPAVTSVNPADYTYGKSTQQLCDLVGSGFGLPAGVGSSATSLSVTSNTAFQPTTTTTSTTTTTVPPSTTTTVAPTTTTVPPSTTTTVAPTTTTVPPSTTTTVAPTTTTTVPPSTTTTVAPTTTTTVPPTTTTTVAPTTTTTVPPTTTTTVAPTTTTTTAPTTTTSTSTSTSTTTTAPTTTTTAPTTTTTSPAAITLSTSTVVQGGSFSLTSKGWKPGTNVDAFLNSTPIFLGTMLADASGVVSGTFAVPANFPTGPHTVTLTGTGIASNVGQTLSAGLTIGAFVQAPTTTAPPAVGTLPSTGSESMTLTGMAFLLLGTGAALVLVARRRAAQA